MPSVLYPNMDVSFVTLPRAHLMNMYLAVQHTILPSDPNAMQQLNKTQPHLTSKITSHPTSPQAHTAPQLSD